MPTSGSGTGTAITCALPGTGAVAMPLKPTLLPLFHYARLMGINPAHFAGGYGTTYYPITNACKDVWPRYAWQQVDRVSHEDIAYAIYNAEQEIANLVGYWPAPMWMAQEVHRWPRHHRRDMWRQGATNVRGARNSIKCNYGKFIQGGRRAVSLVCAATCAGGSLAYQDLDGDGFTETARVQCATTVTDECELKIYHTGQGGAREWEIRPARSKSISGGTFTGYYDAWMFIDPELLAAPADRDGFNGFNLNTTANYVTTVDVYREYNDWTQAAAVFYWEPRPQTLTTSFCTCGGAGCTACTLTTQDGCLHVRDQDAGLVVPSPGSYDADDGEWDQSAFTECRDPDTVKLYYYAGEIDNENLGGETCRTMSDYWGRIIAYLATARLERPFCSCGNVTALSRYLREDLALVGTAGSFQVDPNILRNPLGTRRGEVFAWNQINQVSKKRVTGGAL